VPSHSIVTNEAIGPDAVSRNQSRAAPRSANALVHETRLAHARAPVQREEVAEPRGDGGGRAHARRVSLGRVAFEASHLSLELVAVFTGQAGEVGLPGGRQCEHGTSFFHRGRYDNAAPGRQLGQLGDSPGALGHRVKVPLDALGAPGLEKGRPGFVLPALGRNQIEIVGDVGPTEQLHHARPRLMKRQERDQASGIVLDTPDLESAVGRERPRPLALPCPGEKW